MDEYGNNKLAVLIDADNAQASVCPELLSEISNIGILSVRRAYGDWTTTNLKGWKAHLHKHAINPVQQFCYSQGKNSTDSALIIDAMDLLYAGKLDGFCLVSSDADFTRLAHRLRESGMMVYGFGEKKTPEPFVSACNKFIYTENFRNPINTSNSGKSKTNKLKEIITSSIDAVSNDDGWATLSAVGSHIIRNISSFDPRNYGHSKLGKLVRGLDYLEVEERGSSSNFAHSQIYIKARSE